MKILLLTTHLNAGGITSYLLTLTKGFIREGHEVYIGSSGGDIGKEFIACKAKLIELNIRAKSELDLRIYLSVKPLAQFISDNNIQMIHAQTRVTQILGRMLEAKTKCPYVSTCHGFFKRRLSRVLAPCWGQKVIAISPQVLEHLENDFKVPKEKIELIPNGIEIEQFPLIDEKTRWAARQNIGLGEEPIIGMIARLSDVKGQDILITAMKKVLEVIPKTRLLLIGQGREETKLKNLVKTLNLEEQISFLPTVNRTQQSLALMDIFVMPSRQEGLGLSVMEAQASGLAVIGSNVGGLPSLIKHGQTGLLVQPGNADELAKAIIHLINDPLESRRLGLASREFIREHYSAKRMVDSTLKLYQTVMQKP